MQETLTLIEKTAFLKSVPLLSPIPTEPLAELAASAREIHSDPGDVLFAEGDANRGTFLVIDGLLQLRKGRAVVRVMQSGMAFGELWLGEGEPHQYNLVAIEHTHTLNITRDDVFETVLEYPEFGLGLVRALSMRIHELTSRILDLERVISRLHVTLDQHGIELPALPESVITPVPEDKQLFGAPHSPWPSLPSANIAGDVRDTKPGPKP